MNEFKINNFKNREHHDAMEAARAYGKKITNPAGKECTLHFIANIEERIDKCFASPQNSRNQLRREKLRQAERFFLYQFNNLVEAHLCPTRDQDSAFEDFIDSVEKIRSLTASNAIPSNEVLRRETREMLESIKPYLEKREFLHEEKRGRMEDATHRANFQGPLSAKNIIYHSRMQDITRRRAATKALRDYVFDDSSAGWLIALPEAIMRGINHLQCNGRKDEATHLETLSNELDEKWAIFCRAAALDKGDNVGAKRLSQALDQMIYKFTEIKLALPYQIPNKIPSSLLFEQQRDGLLADIRAAVAQTPPIDIKIAGRAVS